MQTIFQTTRHFLTLGVTLPNTINTHEFHPSIIPGSKFKIPSQYFTITFWLFKILVNLNFFTRCFACIVSPTVSFKNSLINHCCFGTSTVSPWAKATFLHMYFFQYANHQNVMEEEHTKEPSHNNPEEAADCVKAVNTLLQSFVNDIHGFNRYARQDAYKKFLHTLSQLLSQLDSAYFTKMDTEVVLDTIPDKECAAFLERPEETADKVQQCVPVTAYQQAPKLHPKCAYKEKYKLLIRKDKKPSLNYLATFKTHTTTWHK